MASNDRHALLAASMLTAHERMEREIFYGISAGNTTTTTAKPAPALTIATIEKMLDDLPTRETWAVSHLWPAGRATLVKTPDENFTLLNPRDWPTIEAEWRRLLTPAQLASPLYGLNATFLDESDGDSEERRERLRRERVRIGRKITGVMWAHAELTNVFRAWWRRL